mgnify:CR=1 FL=1
MIITIQARSERHAQHIEFRSMLSGMVVDRHGRYLDLTVRDKDKVLGIIKEAGGKVYNISDEVELTKEEMFTK